MEEALGENADKKAFSIYSLLLLSIFGFLIFLHHLPENLATRGPGLVLNDFRFCSTERGNLNDAKESEQSCTWRSAPAPSRIDSSAFLSRKYTVFQTTFRTPAFCKGSNLVCSFFVGTMSDPSRLEINGTYIGGIGDAGPHQSYSQTFPFLVRIPEGVMKPAGENILNIYSFPFGRKNHGLIRGPIGVFPEIKAGLLSEILTGETVVLPLFAASCLVFFGLLSAFSMLSTNRADRMLSIFFAYCLSTALYLVSLSRLPRQYLPVPIGYPLHFSIRFVSEFFFLGMVITFFGRRSIFGEIIRAIYLIFFLLFVFATVLAATGFDSKLLGDFVSDVLWVSNIGAVIFISTSAFGIFFSIRDYKLRREAKYLLVLFFLVLVMQCSDLLALSGIFQDIYFGRLYPVIIAFSFGVSVWVARHGEREKRRVAEELGEMATQIVHDIRAPIQTLKILTAGLEIADQEVRDAIPQSIRKIQNISDSILRKYRRQSKNTDTRESYELCDVIAGAVVGLENSHLVTNTSHPISIRGINVDELELARVLANLIDNAIRACGATAKVTIHAAVEGPYLTISISNVGKGMNQAEVENALLGHSKSGGHGLGLRYCVRTVESWGGRLDVISSPTTGTIVKIHIPN